MTNEQVNRTLAEWMGYERSITLGGVVLYKKTVVETDLESNYVYERELDYCDDWTTFMPCWIKFRDMEDPLTSRQWTMHDSFKDRIETAILNNNTPEPAAKLLAQAVEELKLLK